MKSKNKYWNDLVSSIDPDYKESIEKTLENDPVTTDDYQWLLETKQQLGSVFSWDKFDKQAAKTKLDHKLQNNPEKVSFRLMKSVWFRAAVILIAIISGAFLHSLMNRTDLENVYTEINVPLGQMSNIKLPDGSKVWLNSGSVFKYSGEFDHSTREVFIDGQAFLQVARNAKKPFVVNTTKFSVQVLGTTFNISAYSNENSADVTLVEGLVQIKSGENHELHKIVPGQSATIIDGNLKEINEVNTETFTSWKDGKIVFKKETLENISKKLERWYNVEIRFADDELRQLIFSGTILKDKPVEQIFKSFALLNKDVDFILEKRIDQKDIITIKKRN